MKMNLHQLLTSHGIPHAEPVGGPRCYRIIRFYRNGRKSRTIKSGLTEGEAQEHCGRDDTRKEGVWFDGYDYVKGCKP